MTTYGFKSIMGTVLGAIMALVFAAQVSAMTPTLSLVSNGYGTIQAMVYGDANSPVILDYYSSYNQLVGAGIIGYTDGSGSFSAQINPINYNISNGAQVVVMVNNQQSNSVIWQINGYSSVGSCNYPYAAPGCASNGVVSLSQTNATLAVGQTQTLYVNTNYNNGYYNSNQYYISNPANGIVSATLSNNTITLYGQSAGTTTVEVCSNAATIYNGTNNCTPLYVTVTGSNYYPVPYPYPTPYPNPYPAPYPTPYPTPYQVTTYNTLNVSNSNVQVTVGNSGTVTLYDNGNYNYPYTNGYNTSSFYVSNNNPAIASVIVNGNILTVYGMNAGNTAVTVCSSQSNQCVPVNVTVIAPVYYMNASYRYPSSNGQWYYSKPHHRWMHR